MSAADRHVTSSPKTVRLPDDIRAWYESLARTSGRTLNAVMIAALRDWAQEHGMRGHGMSGHVAIRHDKSQTVWSTIVDHTRSYHAVTEDTTK